MTYSENEGPDGKCPVCSSTDLEWGEDRLEEDSDSLGFLVTPFTCNECDSEAAYWYSLVFEKTDVVKARGEHTLHDYEN